MGGAFGIVSRFPEHLKAFEWAYYEVKDVSGVWHQPIAGTIPMISAFGDNRQAREHPEWIQIGPNGELGTRDSQFFDWDAICPSHDPVLQLALDWAARAMNESGVRTIRLDDVTYAREGFCRCHACLAACQERGLCWEEYRLTRIQEYVRRVRELAEVVEMTLYPDPYPGHLEKRFGIDPNQLSQWVDRFVVPIYDMHYATTYWLEVLAQGFRDRLTRPFAIELYGLSVPEEALAHAALVAQEYADGVLIAYDNHLDKLLRIRERLSFR